MLNITKEQDVCVLCVYMWLGQVTANVFNLLTYNFFLKEKIMLGEDSVWVTHIPVCFVSQGTASFMPRPYF